MGWQRASATTTKDHSSREANNKEQPHAKRQPAKVKTSDIVDPGDEQYSRMVEEDDATTHIGQNGEAWKPSAATTTSSLRCQIQQRRPTPPGRSGSVTTTSDRWRKRMCRGEGTSPTSHRPHPHPRRQEEEGHQVPGARGTTTSGAQPEPLHPPGREVGGDDGRWVRRRVGR